MKRYQVVLATMALGAVVWSGQAMADGPGGEYGAEKMGKVRFIDRRANLIQLDSGLELRTTDARLLKDIHEGMQVQVDYTATLDKNLINSIEPVTSDTEVGVRPTGVGGSGYHG
jgi:hypothetical protein